MSRYNEPNWSVALDEGSALLQALLRIDTRNPPGNELPAAEALLEVLAEDGLDSTILESAPGRANLICRISAGIAAPEAPLLLATHLDVVPPGDETRWRHPPFAGVLADGMLWGRGAIDMKHMVAMSAMVMKLLRRQQRTLRRDVIFVAAADEERGCEHGSRFLVEQHPDKVQAGFALGEVGGHTMQIGKRTVVPVQVAEKGVAWLKLTAHGQAGHASMPTADNALLRLGRAVERLKTPLPRHRTQVFDAFVQQLAALQPWPANKALSLLLRQPSRRLRDGLLPNKGLGRLFDALQRNTATPTMLSAGQEVNVMPATASAMVDGRVLPGQRPEDLIDELREIIDDPGIEIRLVHGAPATSNHPPDSELWTTIQQVIKRRAGLPTLATMIPGFTDGSNFCRLGARWYGFSPLWIEPDSGLEFAELFHGYDERIPVRGFHWGLQTLYEVVDDFCAV